MNYIKEVFSLCEISLDKNGERSLTIVPKGSCHVISKKNSELDPKDDRELFRFVNCDAWELPNDFRSYSGENDLTRPDLRQIMADCGNIVRSLVEENVFLTDRRYYSICTLLIIISYFSEECDVFPRLLVSGNTGGGKTRIQKIFKYLAHRAIKLGNGSYSSSFRIIDLFEPTAIFEELQDYTYDTRREILNLCKLGFEKEDGITRTNPNTLEPEFFNTHSIMVLSTRKTGIIPDDVANRSFVVKMTSCNSRKYQKRGRDKTVWQLARTSLYNMRLVYIVQKEFYKTNPGDHLDLGDYILRSGEFLLSDGIQRIPKGFEDDSEMMECDLRDRPLDIALTLYPFARILGCVEDLISILEERSEYNHDKQVISDNGKVFNAWISLIVDRGSHSKNEFLESAKRISTRDICDRYVEMEREEGNLKQDRDIPETKDIRPIMEDLGFELQYGKGNKTYVKETLTFRSNLESGLRTYCDRQITARYEELPETAPDRVRGLVRIGRG